MCATACRSLVAHSDQHNRPSEDEANSDEQDETTVRSVPSVLLQGAATKRRSQTMTATVSARGTSLRVLREALCVGEPSAQHREEPTVPEVAVHTFRTGSMVKFTDELRKLAAQNHQPPVQSQTASIQ